MQSAAGAVVVEIAFDGVQASTRYPGAMALRFARVKGYRPDKSRRQAELSRPCVLSTRDRSRLEATVNDQEVLMTHTGTLRTWAFIATLVGVFGMIAAAIGAVVWAIEVEGFWQTSACCSSAGRSRLPRDDSR